MSAGWFPYLHFPFHYGCVNHCFQTVGETKHWKSAFWIWCSYFPEQVDFDKGNSNICFKNPAQFHLRAVRERRPHSAKAKSVKWIRCTCAASAGNYPHSRNPITPTGTNWGQQHSPSEQCKGNQVTLGEPGVWIWSNAPALWEVVGLLKEWPCETRKPGQRRWSKSQLFLVLWQSESGQPCAAPAAELQQQPQVPTASIPSFSPLFLFQICDSTIFS